MTKMTAYVNKTQVEKKLKRAIVSLLINHPFWAMLVLRLPMVEKPGVPTMATDGTNIYYNPVFVDKLTHEELMAVIAHETSHVAYLHPFRMGSRDHRRWNVSTDYAINGILDEAGLKLPKGGLLNRAFDDMSAEAIYAGLPDGQQGTGQGQQPQTPPQGQSGGQGQSGKGKPQNKPQQPPQMPQGEDWNVGECLPSQAETPAEQAKAEQEWKMAVVQAAMAAKMEGKLPAGIDRLIERLERPKINWRSVLEQFAEETSKTFTSFSHPSRRYLPDMWVPQPHSRTLGTIVVARDTSGSISEKEMIEFTSELFGIKQAYDCNMVVMDCDAKVQAVHEVEQGEDIPKAVFQGKGGGGTMFSPVFDKVQEMELDPSCYVYFTDGYCSDFPKHVERPTLWICTGDTFKPPFGDVVYVNN